MDRVNLSLAEYFKYLGSNCDSRNVSEGEAVLNAGHVILCGIVDNNDINFNVVALCLQTSNLSQAPHEIKGVIERSDNNCTIHKFECSCKAGLSGKCKHVSAVLLYCTRSNLLEIEIISQTDLKCLWSKQKVDLKNKYEAQPLLTTDCWIARSTTKRKLDASTTAEFRTFFLNNSQESTLSLQMAKKTIQQQPAASSSIESNSAICLNECNIQVADKSILQILYKQIRCNELLQYLYNIELPELKDCCVQTYNNLIVDPEYVSLNTPQSSDVWLHERQFRLTGSRIYQIYTYKGTNWDTKAEKYFWPANFHSASMEHGRKFENNAKQIFAKDTGHQIYETGLIICPNQQWLAYSPDGVIFKDGAPFSLLEIKCPFKGIQKSAAELIQELSYINMSNGQPQLKERHMYYGQVQLGMAILNVKCCNFVIYSSYDDTFINFIVTINSIFIKKMFKKVKNDYFINMIHKICENKIKNK